MTVDVDIKTLTDQDPFLDPAPLVAAVNEGLQEIIADETIGPYPVKSEGSFIVETPKAGRESYLSMCL